MRRNNADSKTLWHDLINCDVRAKLVILHGMTINAAQRVYWRLYKVKPDNFETQGRWVKWEKKKEKEGEG